jgi:dihydropteroate synthase
MTKLVGILNVTPDSFSDGGLFLDPAAALQQADRLFADGASFVDVGAESTRPNATPLTPQAEWQRLEPVLRPLLANISLDSHHPEIFDAAFQIGPVIMNDVTGLNDPKMVQSVIKHQPPSVIICYLPNVTIQEAHRLQSVHTVQEIKDGLLAKARLLESKGTPHSHIILDPGIGFGKTMELNWKLLTFADEVPDYEVMIGYSRKRFLGEHRMALEPNLQAGETAIRHGAAFLRVHDVAGHGQLIS